MGNSVGNSVDSGVDGLNGVGDLSNIAGGGHTCAIASSVWAEWKKTVSISLGGRFPLEPKVSNI